MIELFRKGMPLVVTLGLVHVVTPPVSGSSLGSVSPVPHLATALRHAGASEFSADPATPVIQVFSGNGQITRQLTASEASGSLTRARVPGAAKMSTPAFLLAPPESIARMRDEVSRLQLLPLKKKPDMSLSLAVLDAMSAASTAEAHRRLRALPIRVDHTIGQSSSNERVEMTSVYVRGNLRLRVLSPQPALWLGPAVRGDQDFNRGGPSSDYNDDSSNTPSDESRMFDCDVDPDDPCATQDDRDDVLAECAALQSDLDSAQSDLDDDEASCDADGMCGGDTGLNGSPFSIHVSGPYDTPFDALRDCTGEYVLAASGILWGVSGVLGVVGLASSPDPVSKVFLWAAYTNAAAGVSAAVGGVYEAYKCHYSY